MYFGLTPGFLHAMNKYSLHLNTTNSTTTNNKARAPVLAATVIISEMRIVNLSRIAKSHRKCNYGYFLIVPVEFDC